MNDDTPKAAPQQAPKPAPSPPRQPGLQDRWLQAALGKPVKIRLLDAKTLTGTLAAVDQFALEIRLPGRATTTLLYKHAIAYMALDGQGEVSEP